MSRKRTNILDKANQARDFFKWLHGLSPKARRRYEAALDRKSQREYDEWLDQQTPEVQAIELSDIPF